MYRILRASTIKKSPAKCSLLRFFFPLEWKVTGCSVPARLTGPFVFDFFSDSMIRVYPGSEKPGFIQKNQFMQRFLFQGSIGEPGIRGRLRNGHTETPPLRPHAAAVFLFLFVLLAPGSAHAGYIQLNGVADVKTRYSSGCQTLQETAEIAEASGVDALIINDRARDSLQYGIFPFPRIIKKTEFRPSVLNSNAAIYLSDIRDKNQLFPKTVLIPGVDVSPFYYWSGSVFKKNLVAHNWGKRLSVIGLNSAPELEQLPLLNSNFSRRYTGTFQNTTIGLGFLFFIALALAIKGYHRKFVYPVMFILILFIINYHPFRSSPYDAYHGEQGIGPYQELIDYAVSRGALVFWNNLEAVDGKRKIGNVALETQPHPQDLVLAHGYTGFQAVAEEPVSVTEPGNIWDHVLLQFLRGERAHPVWGYGPNDYRCDGESGPAFGAARTVFLVREKTADAVFDAMKQGRMYAVRQPGQHRLYLDEFVLRDPASEREATLGEELVSIDNPEIRLKIRSDSETEQRAKIYIIRNGKLIKRESVTLPYNLKYTDTSVDMSGPAYYRVNVMVSSVDYLVANPVFVRFGKISSGGEVAALPKGGNAPARLTDPVAPKVVPPLEPPPTTTPQPPPTASAPRPPVGIEPKAPVRPPSPAAPTPPAAGPLRMATAGKTVRVRLDGVSLKKGPGAVFPEWKKVNKGDRLSLVRRTTVEFQGKVWLVVESEGRRGYVWEGLVEVEP